MFPPRPTSLAHLILRDLIAEGDIAVDATTGNGHDTLFLANCVGNSGRVIAFDIQKQAIDSARAKTDAAGFTSRVLYHETCHSRMQAFVAPGASSVVMFNLGYLPGNDHGVTTQPPATLAALNAAATILKPGGALCVTCYPGHAVGAVEADVVRTWMLASAQKGWRCARYTLEGTLRPPPYLVLAGKPRG